jgi:Zn-dependent M28 family amino/carboxypeptidase
MVGAIAVPVTSLEEIEKDVTADVRWLTDEARTGRGPGTVGLDAAGEYIAQRFARLGLRPLPGLSNYYQEFEIPDGRQVGPATSMSFETSAGTVELKLNDDFRPLAWSKLGEFSLPLAFVGYSVSSTRYEYNDFADIDVKGKIVLAMRWEPHVLEGDRKGKSQWTTGDNWSGEASLNRKARAAQDAGAAGIIFVNAPTFHDDVPKLMPLDRGRARSEVPIMHITPEAADKLLLAAGAPSIVELQQQIDSTNKPASRELGSVLVKGNVDLIGKTLAVRNVIGVLPGKGPNKDEYVVVGAHFDHLGFGGMGSRSPSSTAMHPGADDNASGTSAMMALAEAFVLSGARDRSIVFMGYTVEEIGLIGSAHFVRSKILAPEQMTAMVNLDMVGRLRNDTLYIGGSGTASPFEAILDAADDVMPLRLSTMGKGGGGPSDHASFSAAKVPVLFFFTGLHAEYHTPQDTFDTINPNGIAKVVKFSYGVIDQLAQLSSRPAYDDRFDGQQPNIRATDPSRTTRPSTNSATTNASSNAQEAAPRPRPSLGVVPAFGTDESTNGVIIDGVTAGSAADKAGLKAGDRLTYFKSAKVDRKMTNLVDLTEALQESEPGDAVEITYVRDGAEAKVTATLTARAGSQ